MPQLLSIGELAARSGVGVSALRFYDRERVLVPALVDPINGYRRYAESQVRLALALASLRRIGLSLSDIRVILDELDDTSAVLERVDDHLARERRRLDTAEAEADRLRGLLGRAPSSLITLDASELRTALLRVVHAMGAGDSPKVLRGALLDCTSSSVTVIATDRYRLCATEVDAVSSATRRLLLAAGTVDDLLTALPTTGEVRVDADAESAAVEFTGGRLSFALGCGDFPDHRAVLDGEASGRSFALRNLRIEPVDDNHVRLDPVHVVVNRRFFEDATAAADDTATVAVGATPWAPIFVRPSDGVVEALMPVRLEEEA